ncbi:MAG: hypothetical protein ACOCWV_06360, partial [Planctomycetota bacterium]
MKRIICLLVVCGLASVALGGPVVSWTGTHDNTEGTPLTKGELNGYTDENGPQQVFYDGAGGPMTWWVEPGHSGMRINGGNVDDTAGIYWVPGGSYSFDGMADDDVLFRFNLEDEINGNVAIYDNVAALVMNDGILYRSAIIEADPGLQDYIVATKADLAGTWSEYDIATGTLVDNGATIDLADMDDITAFGGSFTPSGGPNNLFIASFEAVPEPATMSLLAMGGLAA